MAQTQTIKKFWGIEVEAEGKKMLAFEVNKTLLFTFDKKAPAPALYLTKKEAKLAIEKSLKSGNAWRKKIQFKKEVEPDDYRIIRVERKIAA